MASGSIIFKSLDLRDTDKSRYFAKPSNRVPQLFDHYQSQQHNRATRYSNTNFIRPRFNRMTEGGRSFAVTTCKLWKSLSLELRNSVSLESFKNNYRNNLFDVQQKLHHFIV